MCKIIETSPFFYSERGHVALNNLLCQFIEEYYVLNNQ